jgi:hypothetical protein
MIVEEIHVADAGTVFQVTIKDGNTPVDISAATVKQIKFQKKGSSTVTKDAIFATNGEDGILEYTTVAGDFASAGTWQLQAHVKTPSGEWSSNIIPFTVFPNL